MIVKTPEPAYYAVIFTSTRTEGDKGYAEMAEKMENLAVQQDGFFGMEAAREEVGITISYWRDLASIKKWKANLEHVEAQKQGQTKWYTSYKVRIAKVESDYDFLQNPKIARK